MSTIQTVFDVKKHFHPSKHKEPEVTQVSTKATGQRAANAIDKKYGTKQVSKVLTGFLINDEFVPVDLSSHWDRTDLNLSEKKASKLKLHNLSDLSPR